VRRKHYECKRKKGDRSWVGFKRIIKRQKALTALTRFDRYNAEVVLSFGTETVLSGHVCNPVGDLLVRWVATLSPLLEVIGAVLSAEFVEKWAPVFSGKTTEDFTLVVASALVVGGRVITCVNSCGAVLSTALRRPPKGKGQSRWKIVCDACGSSASYRPDNSQIEGRDRGVIIPVPGNKSMFRTPYPPLRKNLDWKKITQPAMPPSEPTLSLLPVPSSVPLHPPAPLPSPPPVVSPPPPPTTSHPGPSSGPPQPPPTGSGQDSLWSKLRPTKRSLDELTQPRTVSPSEEETTVVTHKRLRRYELFYHLFTELQQRTKRQPNLGSVMEKTESHIFARS